MRQHHRMAAASAALTGGGDIQSMVRVMNRFRLRPLSFLRWLVPCLGLFVAACSEEEPAAVEKAAISDPHGDAIREMLKAPRRFQEVVATIHDEASYDRAAPGLSEVVDQFKKSAAIFRELNPPEDTERAKYRQMIAEGTQGAEPTGRDIIALISVKGRDKEIHAWMDAFAESHQEVKTEVGRLYGEIAVAGAGDEERIRAQFSLQLEEQLRAQLPDLKEKQPVLPPVPLEAGDNPLLRHLDGPGTSDE